MTEFSTLYYLPRKRRGCGLKSAGVSESVLFFLVWFRFFSFVTFPPFSSFDVKKQFHKRHYSALASAARTLFASWVQRLVGWWPLPAATLDHDAVEALSATATNSRQRFRSLTRICGAFHLSATIHYIVVVLPSPNSSAATSRLQNFWRRRVCRVAPRHRRLASQWGRRSLLSFQRWAEHRQLY